MLLNAGHILHFGKYYPQAIHFSIWSKTIMARSGWLNPLVVFLVSTNLMNSLDALPAAPASAPTPHLPPSPAPPLAPSPHLPPSPWAPSPHLPPSPSAPTPHSPPSAAPPSSPTPNLPPPPPQPAPAPPAGRGGSSGLSGGQKAGIVIGVLLGAVLIGFGGMVYKKRQNNIRRNRYSNAAREFNL